MTVYVKPASQADYQSIAGALEDIGHGWPNYMLRAAAWPDPHEFVLSVEAAGALMAHLYDGGRTQLGDEVKAASEIATGQPPAGDTAVIDTASGDGAPAEQPPPPPPASPPAPAAKKAAKSAAK